MTAMNDAPSILILRSTCGADGAIGDDHSNALNSLPLWCDLTVVPEMDDSKHVSVHVEEQGLNPCGIDNVLLLQDLAPGQGYLMSLLNCYTVVGGDDENEEAQREIPISTNPSTFFFDVPANPSVKDSGVMINTKKSSTELQVGFDMTAAMQDLELVSDQEEQHTAYSPPPAFEAPTNNTTYQHSYHNQDELLRVLETLASREVQDLDLLLVSLGAIFSLLVGVYAWIVVSMIKKGKVSGRKSGSKKSARSIRFSSCRSTAGTITPHPSTTRSVAADNDRRIEVDIPPVVDVIIDRSKVPDSPRFGDRQPRASSVASTAFNDCRTEADVPSVVNVILDHHNQDDEPPLLVDTNESDLVKSIRASPVFASFSRGKQKPVTAQVAKPLFMPVRDQSTKPTSPPPRFLVPPSPSNSTQQETARDLSPCSKLARDWEQKKAVRRNKRRNRGSTAHLVPVAAVPEDIPVTEDDEANNVPIKNRKRLVPVLGDDSSTPPEDLPYSAGVPTSVSDGSFLNDYW